MSEHGNNKSEYRGYLVSRYDEVITRYRNTPYLDQNDLCTEYVKLAVQVWLTGAILHLCNALENWLHNVPPDISPEGMNLLEQATDRFAEFTDNVRNYWSKLDAGEASACSDSVPVLDSWIREVEFVYKMLNSEKLLFQEERLFLKERLLQKMVELRDDMVDVQPIFKDLVQRNIVLGLLDVIDDGASEA
jgi:hypothetical protein